MALLNFNFKKTYKVKTRCNNCTVFQDLVIPMGQQIATYIKSEGALCYNCGCNTLSLLRV